MTANYDPAGTTVLDRIRNLLGDTDPTVADLQDEEIAVFQELAGAITLPVRRGVLFHAAYLAANALAIRYAGAVNYSISRSGSMSMSAGDKYAHYTQVADRMQSLMSSSPIVPYAGGIRSGDKQAREQDLGRVQPFFTREQGTEPGTEPDSPGPAYTEAGATFPI
ncbi:MAG: hypothetical protein JWO59_732 [Chloroflexi bacterium]|nr:hypothetical protein [Chloroflexota bacterium]